MSIHAVSTRKYNCSFYYHPLKKPALSPLHTQYVFGTDGTGVSARLLHISWTDINWRATVTEDIPTSWRLASPNTKEPEP